MISLKSHINANSVQFQENKEAMIELLEKLEKHMEESRFEGKEKQINKARSRSFSAFALFKFFKEKCKLFCFTLR